MKNKILPIVTIVIVLIAICIIFFIPKNNDNKESKIDKNEANTVIASNNVSNTSSGKNAKKIEATANDNGDIEIKLDDLDSSNATFINYKTANGYEIELVAVKDSNNNIDIAFNTCQVCNGSPKAYFTQKNGKLICQNCGNIFSLKSVGQGANGCNPMTLEDNNFTKTETGINKIS